MLIVTIAYDKQEGRGAWGLLDTSSGQVTLLDVAQALAWAQQDVFAKLQAANLTKEGEENEEA